MTVSPDDLAKLMAGAPPDTRTPIGYGTPYGNPYVGQQLPPGEAIRRFRLYATRKFATDLDFREAVIKLRGRILICPGCGVGARGCHGRILEQLYESVKDDD